MPGTAHGQLYVLSGDNSTGLQYSEYDTTTGAQISAPFPGFSGFYGYLALSGNVLFVSSGSGGGSSPLVNTISEYDTTSGAPIGPTFPNPPNVVQGLAASGNNLFVLTVVAGADFDSSITTIYEYDATTGNEVATPFPTPPGIGTSLAVSGNKLFVLSEVRTGATTFDFQVTEYNTMTGAQITTPFPNFQTSGLGCLAVSGNDLFVATDVGTSTISEYDATTGAPVGTSFSNPTDNVESMAIWENNLFVLVADTATSSLTISEYNTTTGALVGTSFADPPGTVGNGVSGSLAVCDPFCGSYAGTNLNVSFWFGYYTTDTYPIIYEYNLGYEYVIPTAGGVYLYDYISGHFWYTQAGYFPFVYDFSLNCFLYYYHVASPTPHRHFYKFSAVNPGIITE